MFPIDSYHGVTGWSFVLCDLAVNFTPTTHNSLGNIHFSPGTSGCYLVTNWLCACVTKLFTVVLNSDYNYLTQCGNHEQTCSSLHLWCHSLANLTEPELLN